MPNDIPIKSESEITPKKRKLTHEDFDSMCREAMQKAQQPQGQVAPQLMQRLLEIARQRKTK